MEMIMNDPNFEWDMDLKHKEQDMLLHDRGLMQKS